jgi:hypothetical protein
VFGRENGGFDVIIGNPPFLGGSKISSQFGSEYLAWLLTLHEESHGNGDLVAHFYRRGFSFLRTGAAFGLIATNTIGQGDTRSTGLRWICQHGGTIFFARRRYRWPGQAAVIVSIVHVFRGISHGPFDLDGREVDCITAYLFHAGGSEEPAKLAANKGKSFLGSKIYGQGFTFDDSDPKGIASTLEDMQRLVENNPRNLERIFPYLGGQEVNESPTHGYHRYVINFGEISEEEARQWPDLMRIVEEKVKPERIKNNRDTRRKYWWRFGETTPALFAAICDLERVLVCSRIGNACAFTFLPHGVVMNEKIIVFPFSQNATQPTLLDV